MFAVVPVRDQKGTRCVRHGHRSQVQPKPCAPKAAAAPATVSGEPPADYATGNPVFLGRRPETATREPGDLPPATVTRERVGRGVLANSVRLLCYPHGAKAELNQPKSR